MTPETWSAGAGSEVDGVELDTRETFREGPGPRLEAGEAGASSSMVHSNPLRDLRSSASRAFSRALGPCPRGAGILGTESTQTRPLRAQRRQGRTVSHDSCEMRWKETLDSEEKKARID
jgi:hypothetical protein